MSDLAIVLERGQAEIDLESLVRVTIALAEIVPVRGIGRALLVPVDVPAISMIF